MSKVEGDLRSFFGDEHCRYVRASQFLTVAQNTLHRSKKAIEECCVVKMIYPYVSCLVAFSTLPSS